MRAASHQIGSAQFGELASLCVPAPRRAARAGRPWGAPLARCQSLARRQSLAGWRRPICAPMGRRHLPVLSGASWGARGPPTSSRREWASASGRDWGARSAAAWSWRRAHAPQQRALHALAPAAARPPPADADWPPTGTDWRPLHLGPLIDFLSAAVGDLSPAGRRQIQLGGARTSRPSWWPPTRAGCVCVWPGSNRRPNPPNRRSARQRSATIDCSWQHYQAYHPDSSLRRSHCFLSGRSSAPELCCWCSNSVLPIRLGFT